MALKDDPKKGGPEFKRAVIESHGEVPKVSPDNDEDTETAIETPFARDQKAEGEGDADETEARADKPGASAPHKKKAGRAGEAAGAAGASSTSAASSASGAASDGPAKPDELAAWMVPAFVVALLLLFVGERIVPSDETLRYAFSGLGALGVAATTAYRLRAMARAGGERRDVERILALLMLGGAVAIALYFASTDGGKAFLGLARLKAETRARVSGAMTVTWVVLLAVSAIPLLFGELALAPMRRAERVEVRRVRAATLGGATLAFAACYVALFTYAAGELEVKADYSYYRTSRPGESTKNIAATLTEPVTVTAFFPQQNDVGDEVKGYLTELSQAAPNIQPKFQDRLLVPALAKELKVTQDGVLVLQRGESKETVNLGAEMKTAQAKLKTLDADFQKALLKTMRAARIAYFTVGHGEMNENTGPAAAAEGRTSKNLKTLLEKQNYVVKDLGLANGLQNTVPNDASLVVVLAPSQALMPAEVESLRRYADGGGRLILALDPDGKIDLSPLAEIAGLTWKPAVLATDDARNFYPLRRNDSDHAILLTNKFSSHASVSTLSKVASKTRVVFRGAAALDKAAGTTATIDFAVKSFPETFNDDNASFTFDQDAEKRATYNLAAAVTKPVPGGEKDANGKDKEMRVFALGDADALSDGAVGDTPNGLMALDVIRWLGGDESFLGAITSNEDVKIEHTKQKDSVWFYGTVFAVPLGILGVGFLVTRRRRTGARRAAA